MGKSLSKGVYLRRRDGKTFSNGQSFIEVKSYQGDDNKYFINNRYKILLSEVLILDEAGYNRVKKEIVLKARKTRGVDGGEFYEGCYIRMCDWGFFSNDLPVMRIAAFYYKGDIVHINGFDYNKNNLVIVGREQADRIVKEFELLKLGVGSGSVRSCVNRENRAKITWTELDALKYVFTYNKSHTVKMAAYECVYCGEVHVGHKNLTKDKNTKAHGTKAY